MLIWLRGDARLLGTHQHPTLHTPGRLALNAAAPPWNPGRRAASTEEVSLLVRIAIVEDEADQREQLRSYIEQYGGETGQQFDVGLFSSGQALLDGYTPIYDIILLDIEMPGINGMETAEHIRALDNDVVLMFVTNMAQYAINGYSVGALDFVLKPVNYYTFTVRFARALNRARQRQNGQILLTLPDCVRRLDTQQIYYVEVQNRMLHYHTELGEFVLRGTMQSAEKELSRYHFVRCNHWYLVNLSHVAEVRRDMVVVAGTELEISRRNRTAFLTALTEYVGGNG